MQKLISYSIDETYEIGRKIGSQLKKGYIICMTGDLGAGKTALTKGIAAGLKIKDYVVSPTYTLINEYKGQLPLYHFDVYRLNGCEDMYDLGYEEYFYGDGVVVVEWADIVEDLIPEERLWITIKRTNKEDERIIILEPKGSEYETIVKEMEKHEGISN